MSFFTLPNNAKVYPVVHLTNASNHDSNSILFERWGLENSIKSQQNGQMSISPSFHVVDVDTFGSAVLAIEDYKISQLESNTEFAMVCWNPRWALEQQSGWALRT